MDEREKSEDRKNENFLPRIDEESFNS